jgi:membrane protein implicated in regulation of membrane protease activity
MMEWFEQIVFWHWLILAGVLLILELTAPVFFFLWLGIAALVVSVIMIGVGDGFARVS